MKKKTGIIASSVAAIAVCTSMIAGSTFALFTSNSEVNIAVTSAKVDVKAVAVQDTANTDINNEASVKAPDEVNDFWSVENMLPGDVVAFNVNIENNSTISVKYRVVAELTNKVGAWEVLYNGAELQNGKTAWAPLAAKTNPEKPLTLSIALPESETDQNSACNISIRVEAIQGNASDETLEDLDATHVTVDDIYPANGWNWLSHYGFDEEVKLVKLDADIDKGNEGLGIEVPKVNLNGNTITSGQLSVWNYTTEIYGGTINHSDGYLNGDETAPGQHVLYVMEGANVTLRDVTINAKEVALNNLWAMYIENYGEGTGNTKVIIEDGCVVNGHIGMYSDSADHPAYLTINGGVFNSDYEGQYFDAEATYNSYIEINDGTFNCNRLFGNTVTKDMAVIKGGKFKCDPTAWVADGYEVVQEGDYYVVKPAA